MFYILYENNNGDIFVDHHTNEIDKTLLKDAYTTFSYDYDNHYRWCKYQLNTNNTYKSIIIYNDYAEITWSMEIILKSFSDNIITKEHMEYYEDKRYDNLIINYQKIDNRDQKINQLI